MFLSVMADFNLITGIIFVQYDQYISGGVTKANDAIALKKIETYLLEKLLI